MAVTNTELYRPFDGELRAHPLRCLPLAWAGIRVGWKKKLPLIGALSVPVIATVIVSAIIYAKFGMQQGIRTEGVTGQASTAVGLVSRMIEVRALVAQFNLVIAHWAFLVMTWYGAGLIAEDRRHKAHLLYFSRPLTRLDYFAGKFLVASFYGSCGLLFPGLVICFMAAVTSPDWSFLEQEGDVVWKTVVYGLGWTTVFGSAVLAVSSLTTRRAFAMVAVFALAFGSVGLSEVLREVTGEVDWRLLNVFECFHILGNHLYGIENLLAPDWPTWKPLGVLGGLTAVSLLLISRRLRRMEVVA